MKEAPRHNMVKWTEQGFEGEYYSIATPVYDSTVNSGTFGLLKPCLQTSVADIYDRIHGVQFWTDQIMQYYSTPVYVSGMNIQEANKLSINLEKRSKETLKEFDKVIIQLKSTKKNLL